MSHDDKVNIDKLVENLDDIDADVRKNARFALANLGKDAVPALIKGLQSKTNRRCWESAKVLVEIDDPRWFAPMVDALKSSNPMLGQIALEAIITHPNFSPKMLLDALDDAHHMLKPHLIKSIVQFKVYDAIPSLINSLKESKSALMRHILIEALVELDASDALELIATFADDEDSHVRKRVARAIEKFSKSDS